jgi:hypothetical protein
MRTIGKVELIINSEFLLISSSEELSRNQIVTVFQKLENDDFRAKYGVDFLAIPKGDIFVTNEASNKFYLCQVFREVREKKKIITRPSEFEKIYGGALQNLFKTTKEEIIETTDANCSAILDREQSLGFVLKKEIGVGDLVGII